MIVNTMTVTGYCLIAGCPEGELSCLRIDQCVNSNAFCNNVTDCMDGTDEAFCGKFQWG